MRAYVTTQISVGVLIRPNPFATNGSQTW